MRVLSIALGKLEGDQPGRKGDELNFGCLAFELLLRHFSWRYKGADWINLPVID